MSLKSSIMQIFNNAALAFRGTSVQEALEGKAMAGAHMRPAAALIQNEEVYDPEAETDSFAEPVLNPVIAFHQALESEDPSKLPQENPFRGIKVSVAEAYLYEGMFNAEGQLAGKEVREAKGIPWPASYRIRHVVGDADYRKALESARTEWQTRLPAKIKEARKTKAVQNKILDAMKEAKLVEDTFSSEDGFNADWGPYDPNQYTEYAPTYGGPFFKQLYLWDYLRMHTLAFETWNHNPIAKRIIELMSQYSFGRRFKVRIKDPKKEKAWKDFDQKYNIRESASRFWVREFCIYGEIMLNLDTWQLIDPSTVWDIITDPDDLTKVYYYYQSYPTAFQQFTGLRVPGEPGSEKVKAQEYILRQIPAYKVLHLKGNCVSNEKRGRSLLFPVLGWLKRIKDLYNAIVVRQWLMSCFIWDDTVKGSAADIAAHASQYNRMPTVGSTFVHNESVTRQPMAAIDSAGGKGSVAGIGEEIISFIATAVGIPKEFLNVMSQSGGNRASALTSAEPFTKVIENLQAVFEALLMTCAKKAFEQAGIQYEEGDIEFIFPSVTKDTTTETIKNIGTGESMGYLSKRTAAEMYAAEMNITNYDFEKEQEKLTDDARQGLNQSGLIPMPPDGRFGSSPGTPGNNGGSQDNPDDEGGDSPIHGKGKVALSRTLKRM